MQKLNDRGLKRRIKRHIRNARHEYFATTAAGVEYILQEELASLPNVTNINSVLGGVEFTGDLEAMYHANIRLRSAGRILLRISEFLAQSYPMLYDHTRQVKWERYLGFRPDYIFSVSAKRSRLRHKRRIAATCEAAITEYSKKLGLEPTSSEMSTFEFYVRLFQDRCSLSFNSSGDHLHRRGYRKHLGVAPMRETLAAIVLKLSNVDQYSIVVDPFCGSGVLLVEAAHMATGRLPGVNRSFSFQEAPYYNNAILHRIVNNAPLISRPNVRYIGSDISSREIRNAAANAKQANVNHLCGFSVKDARRVSAPIHTGKALVISNLPYNKRVAIDSELIHTFSKHLKEEFSGWDYAFLTTHPETFIRENLYPSDTTEISNGGIPVHLIRGTIP